MSHDMMTAAEAADYAPQWGSLIRAGDPGACMYGAIPPETAAHRDSMLEHIRGELIPIADESPYPEHEGDSDELRRLVAYLESIPYPAETISGLEGVEVSTVNYSGHRFDSFFVSTDAGSAPGWFVYGRNAEKYGRLRDGRGAYISLCARPDVPPRSHPHYNGRVRRGWHLKREAQAVADALNAESPLGGL